MTHRLKKTLEGPIDTLHQRMLYALMRDIAEMCRRENAVPGDELLALVAEYDKADHDALRQL
jgi:hypothetical protein